MSDLSAPALVTLETHHAGETWQGIPVIGPIIINEAPPGVVATRVSLSLARNPATAGAVIAMDTEAGDGVFPITIVDADAWEFMIPPISFEDFAFPPGNYQGYLKITDANNERIFTHDVRLIILPG